MCRFAPDAPSDVKTFLTNKQKGNKEFLEFFTGSPDVSSDFSSIVSADKIGGDQAEDLLPRQRALEVGGHRHSWSYHPSHQEVGRTIRRRL